MILSERDYYSVLMWMIENMQICLLSSEGIFVSTNKLFFA